MRPTPVILVVVLAAAACVQTPPSPSRDASCVGAAAPQDAGPSWDAGDPASCACARLQAWGCPLGNDPNCAAAFRVGSRFGADPACVLRATDLSGLPSCNVTCR